MFFRRRGFVLTPPSIPFFIVSVVLAAIACAMYYFGLRIQLVSARYAFDILAVGYLVLLVAVLFRRV
jgi:drug/metabolite transporter (DMT)-like permease